MVMGTIVEAVKTQQLGLLAFHIAYYLEAHPLVSVPTASASSPLAVRRTAVQITVVQSEANWSTRDFCLADLHTHLLSICARNLLSVKDKVHAMGMAAYPRIPSLSLVVVILWHT
jgi:hypothetical protein